MSGTSASSCLYNQLCACRSETFQAFRQSSTCTEVDLSRARPQPRLGTGERNRKPTFDLPVHVWEPTGAAHVVSQLRPSARPLPHATTVPALRGALALAPDVRPVPRARAPYVPGSNVTVRTKGSPADPRPIAQQGLSWRRRARGRHRCVRRR